MNKIIYCIFFMLCRSTTTAQNQTANAKDTLIIGSKKYLPAVIKIYQQYKPIIDTLTNNRINSRTGTGTIHYAPGKSEGYYINEELNQYEKLINRFLSDTKVKAAYHYISGKKKGSYYEVTFISNNPDLKNGVVRWYEE